MGPEIRIKDRLQGARPKQSVNKYNDKRQRLHGDRKLLVSGEQRLEGQGAEGLEGR